MRVRMRRRAVADFIEIREWLRLTSDGAAERFSQRVERALDQLEQHERSGTAYIAGTRRLVLSGTPYMIIYSVDADGVVVRNIAHTSRKPGYWIERD